MNEVPSDLLALSIWWALTWRTFLLGLLTGILIGFVIGIIGDIFGTHQDALAVPSILAGAVVSVFVSVKVIKRLMTVGFGEYRLAIAKK